MQCRCIKTGALKIAPSAFRGRFFSPYRVLTYGRKLAFDPFQLPLDKTVCEFIQLKGIPGALRDAAPDAWGQRVIKHQLERDANELHKIDYLLHGPQDGAGDLWFGRKAARPKATIEDAGQLWLGKFPARDDRFNLQRVE